MKQNTLTILFLLKHSDLDECSLSNSFWQATNVQNFKTPIVIKQLLTIESLLDHVLIIIGVAPNYAVTHVRNKNSNIQRRSPNVVKVIFHTIRNCS